MNIAKGTKGALLKRFGKTKKTSKAHKKNDSRRFLGKALLSIDIGQHTTKLVLGKLPKQNVIEIKQAVTFKTPRGSVEKGRFIDFEALAAQIQNVISAEKPGDAFVFCTIENAEIITREIVLPTADTDDMRNMLEYEVQQYMPVDLGNYIIQSKMLNTFTDDQTSKTRFLSTAVPKDLAQSYFDLLQRVNLKASVLDIQSNSIDKLAQAEMASASAPVFPADEPIAIIDFGYSHINAVIIDNGKYQFNRYIDQGAISIDRSLMGVFNFSEEEIEHRKYGDIDLSKSSAAFSDANEDEQTMLREINVIKNAVDNWADELERVFRYYSSRNSEKTINKIFIHGGTAQINGLDAYLAKVLGMPVERIGTLSCVKMQDGSSRNMTPYLNAIGAFIRR